VVACMQHFSFSGIILIFGVYILYNLVCISFIGL